MNIFLKGLFFFALTVAVDVDAQALDPDRAVSQYLRDQWTAERGFPGGPVNAIMQTKDGYLWVGTESGLFRFDGINFTRMRDPDPTALQIDQVLGLTVDDSGQLFVRLPDPTLLRQSSGVFVQVSPDAGQFDSRATAIARASSGEVLVASRRNGLDSFRQSRFQSLVSADKLPAALINSIAATSPNDVWLGTRDQGLFHWQGKQVIPIAAGAGELRVNCLLSGAKGELWVGTDQGVFQWNGRDLVRPQALAPLVHEPILALIEDRGSNIWIGTRERGLIRWNTTGLAYLDPTNSLPRLPVYALFEDREGDIWSGTSTGVERLRDRAFVTHLALGNENNGSVYADPNDRVWWGPASGGLRWLSEGKIREVTQAGLDKDVVYSITGNGEDLWVGRQNGGLTHLHIKNGSFQSDTYTQADGLAANAVFAVTQSADGAVWAGTLNAGVTRIQDGKFTVYGSKDGLAADTVNAITAGNDGVLWFATPAGLTSLSHDRWHIYGVADGLPSANVNCLLQSSGGALWIGTTHGIALLQAGRISVPSGAPMPLLRGQIFGMAEDRIGSLWIVTSDHIFRVARDKLMRGSLGDGDLREYGLPDGAPLVEGIKRDRSIVAGQFGRIWLTTNSGIAEGDPARLVRSAVRTLVHIESISADGIPLTLTKLHIPAGTRRIAIRYKGLNLSAPERIRFRFALDGFDHSWNTPLDGNEAFYTNLNPGPYRFHIAASNPDGAWNGDEESIALSVDPAFWQTWWFRTCFISVLAITMIVLYRSRLRQVSRQLNIRFDERLTERNRIARELHDTLLQTIQGSKMVADDALEPNATEQPDPERMRRALEKLTVWLNQAVEEGRTALNSLRSPAPEGDDLAEAFERAARECMRRSSVEVNFSVHGSVKPVQAIARDEIYHIGYEAIRNSCNHSGGSLLEVELNFKRNLELRVRDNGKGIDPALAAAAKPNHFGLTGMSERAARLGGKLSLFTSAHGGTEMELIVPGNIAFGEPVPLWRRLFLRRSVSE